MYGGHNKQFWRLAGEQLSSLLTNFSWLKTLTMLSEIIDMVWTYYIDSRGN